MKAERVSAMEPMSTPVVAGRARARSTSRSSHHQGLQRSGRRPQHAHQPRHGVAACSCCGGSQRTTAGSRISSCPRRRRSSRASATRGAATSRAAGRLSEHFWWSLYPRLRRVPARVRHRGAHRHRDGRVAHRARHLRSADRVLPAAAAARLPAAHRDLVRHRRDREDRADLPRVLRAARNGGARGRAQRDHRADQRRILDGRIEMAGDLPRHHPRRHAGDPDGNAHCDRLRMDDARGRRDGRGQPSASARWCSTRRTSCAPTS